MRKKDTEIVVEHILDNKESLARITNVLSGLPQSRSKDFLHLQAAITLPNNLYRQINTDEINWNEVRERCLSHIQSSC